MLNMSKVNVFILGDLNIHYKNKAAPNYKRLHFFNQSNALSHYINNTMPNTDKSKSLIDLALTNSKFVSDAGTLSHFISDHQSIYFIHKKGRDVRKTVVFEGRSYRNYSKDKFKDMLTDESWDELYNCETQDPPLTYILNKLTSCLDCVFPVRKFRIRNYKPDWMTRELI